MLANCDALSRALDLRAIGRGIHFRSQRVSSEYETQEAVNDQTWILPGEMARHLATVVTLKSPHLIIRVGATDDSCLAWRRRSSPGGE